MGAGHWLLLRTDAQMKNIGILTFHYVDNYGAVLQAWALRKVLNSMPGVNAEIINYIPDGYMIWPYICSEKGISDMKRKRERYEFFLTEKCGITDGRINQVSGDGYDYCCVGSDQVWNLKFRENATYEYLFPNLNDDVPRFSYAPSIGGMIEEKDKGRFLEWLSRFKSISVREEYSVGDLARMGVSGAVTVIDPTLLLQEKDYEALIEEPENKPDKYIFFFSYPIDEDMRRYAPFVNRLAIENGLNIMHSFPDAPAHLFICDCGSMMYEGIGEFLWYMKHASVVVTTSYHGAIFGRLFDHPTYIIRRNTGWGRFEHLNKIMGLENAVVSDDWLMKNWDIDRYYAKDELDIWRRKSINFLNGSLDNRKKRDD